MILKDFLITSGFMIFILNSVPWFIAINIKSGGLFWAESIGNDLLNKVNLFGYYFASIDIRLNRREIMRSLKFVETKNKKPLDMKTSELLSYSGNIKLKSV